MLAIKRVQIGPFNFYIVKHAVFKFPGIYQKHRNARDFIKLIEDVLPWNSIIKINWHWWKKKIENENEFFENVWISCVKDEWIPF